MTRGRKRKLVHREPNGRAQRPPDYANMTAADNQCVVIEARSKQNGTTKESAKDPNWGHTLGCLMLQSIIDKRQMNAGNEYMQDYFRYTQLKGFPPRNPKVASYAQMIAGMASNHTPDNDTVKRAENRVRDAQTAIVEALGITQSIPAFRELERFAVNQENWKHCTEARAGPLKECLNALARHYGC